LKIEIESRKIKESINFFSEQINFNFRNRIKVRNWIILALKKEKRSIDSVNFIFCSDSYLRKLNKTFLGHNYMTDVITFGYSNSELTTSKKLSGDIYISIDRVKENAKEYSKSFYSELHRVMIHGVLHLIGYEDNTDKKKKQLTLKEDYYLSLLRFSSL
jgi:probable rRNA maturation factor